MKPVITPVFGSTPWTATLTWKIQAASNREAFKPDSSACMLNILIESLLSGVAAIIAVSGRPGTKVSYNASVQK